MSGVNRNGQRKAPAADLIVPARSLTAPPVPPCPAPSPHAPVE